MGNNKEKRIWTEEEIDLLVKEYPTGRKQDLIKLFNRTYASICHKAGSLGLKKKDRGWTLEQIDILKEHYSTSITKELEEKIGKTYQAVMGKVRELNICKEPIWTEEEVKLLKKNYSINKNCDLEKLFNKSLDSIKHKAYKLGIKKDKKTLNKVYRKYSILKEDYFYEIDNGNKAYLLGFIIGDGSLHKGRSRLAIHIHQQDQELLDFMRIELGTNSPILRSKSNDYIVLYISSYHIIKGLHNLGIHPNKTFSVKFPEISPDLHSHLVRGIFDADGSSSINKGSSQISWAGNEDICRNILYILRNACHIGGGLYKNRGTYYCNIGGRNQVARVFKWLYQDAPFYLSRKYNKFIEGGLLESPKFEEKNNGVSVL